MTVLNVPDEWKEIYIKLLTVISQSGEAILNDCSYGCKGDGSVMFNAWNIFQAACAAHALGDTKLANLYIGYVEKQVVNKFGELKSKDNEQEGGTDMESN
uniref:Coat protein n=1 Tax=Geladintestivirus 3 TaxID=3233135 RepID=A0AAU8MIJ0_9CAUD